MKKNNKKRIFLYLIIPGMLLGFWVLGALFFNDRFSYSVLTYSHSKTDIISSPQEKLLKGQKIRGEFTARDNHLGLLILKFNNYLKYDFNTEDYLIFRIKEKGSKEWYHTGAYRSGALQAQLHYPFGLPVIDSSKGKVYEFELESTNGTEKNAVALNRDNPKISTGYQYPPVEVSGSKKRALGFIIKKSIISFSNIDFLLSSLIYLIPFLIYIFTVRAFVKLKKISIYFAMISVTLILLDIIVFREVNLGILLILILSWYSTVKLCKFDSRFSFALALACVSLWLVLMILKVEIISHKLNIWVYTFLAFGLIQSIIEEKRNLKQNIKFSDLLRYFR